MNVDFSFLSDYWGQIGEGIFWTIAMTFIALVPGALIGVFCAIARVHGSELADRIVGYYVELIRNTPSLIQAFWLFFGLSSLGFHLSPFTAAVIALTINFGAYVCEIVRAGLEATPTGQIEAADCLAFTPAQRIAYIELPQAVERVYPALVGQSILMMLSTAIMYQISAQELTGVAWLIQSFTFRSFEIYMVVAAIYIVVVALMRGLLNCVGLMVFTRSRKLRTPL